MPERINKPAISMATSETQDGPLPAAAQQAESTEGSHAGRDLLQTQLQLLRRTEELAKSEAQLRSALKAGRLVYWETDLESGNRHWTPDAMALFGIDLPDGCCRFGGDADEFNLAVQPDDRHMTP